MNRKITAAMLALIAMVSGFVAITGWTNDKPSSTAAISSAVSRSFNLLQTSNSSFIMSARCATCHHSTLTSMIAQKLESKGITALDTTLRLRQFATSQNLHYVANPNNVKSFITAKFITPYTLMGLNADGVPASFDTDIAVDYLFGQAFPDGHFEAEYARAPLEAGDIHLTAMAMRAILLYASPAKAARAKDLAQKTSNWLNAQQPSNQQDLCFKLMGLKWCGASKEVMEPVASSLIGMQFSNGGWSQLSTMKPDAYATGQALFALSESGFSSLVPSAYQKGIDYLLTTQEPSGAWYVRTRSNPIQPFMDSGFPPYDENQFISAAASGWATLALVDALPNVK